jgi:hypothetical protein
MTTLRTLCRLALGFLACFLCLASSVRAQLMLVDASTDSLYTVDSSSGAATLVGPLGFSFNSIAGLAFDPNSRTLYYSGLTGVGLHRLDLGTGKGTKIGNLAQNMPSLAYDADGDVLYGISGATDSLYVVDPSNAALTLIGPLGVNIARNGAAYDAKDGCLYMINDSNGNLYCVNPDTGQATLIGPVGGDLNINGLAVDSSGRLYGASGSTDSLYELSKETGTATLIGPLGVNVDVGVGLAYAAEGPPNWMLYAEGETEPANDGTMEDIDTFAGISSHLGRFTGEGRHILYPDLTFEGCATYTASDGDQLDVFYTGSIVTFDESPVPVQGHFEIVGGTGRFANTTGFAKMTGEFTGVPGELAFVLFGTLHPQGK